MSAKKKYTAEFVIEELKAMYEELLANDKIYFIKALFKNRPYSQQRLSEWRKEFRGDEFISEAIKKIEDELESRIVQDCLQGKLNPTMSIFCLKNNYGWSNEPKATQGTGRGFILEIRGHKPQEESKNPEATVN